GMDPADSASLHRFRIAFKKFRYQAEVWAEVRDRQDPGWLEELQGVQRGLGSVLDLDVVLAWLERTWKKRDRGELLAVQEGFRRTRSQVYSQLEGRLRSLEALWCLPVLEPVPVGA
ncbi:MAG: CHAD domain-containing protein, partial [Candidatus Eremiobacterota bacterium]